MRCSEADHCIMPFPQDVFLLWQQSNPLSTFVDNAAKGAHCLWWWIRAGLKTTCWKALTCWVFESEYMPTCSQLGLFCLLYCELTVMYFMWLSLWLLLAEKHRKRLYIKWGFLICYGGDVQNSCESKVVISVTFASIKVTSCFSVSTWSDWRLCAYQAY